MAITSALKAHKINTGHFPAEMQRLGALVRRPADEPRPVDRVQVMHNVPKDSWGRAYSICYREKEKRTLRFVASKGPDPEIAADDIVHPAASPKENE